MKELCAEDVVSTKMRFNMKKEFEERTNVAL